MVSGGGKAIWLFYSPVKTGTRIWLCNLHWFLLSPAYTKGAQKSIIIHPRREYGGGESAIGGPLESILSSTRYLELVLIQAERFFIVHRDLFSASNHLSFGLLPLPVSVLYKELPLEYS